METVLESFRLNDREYSRISEVIHKYCGINLHQGKKSLIQSRLSKLLRQNHFHSFSDYLDYVLSEEGREEFTVMVNTLSTNLTFFFREKPHFDYLRSCYLPELVQKNKSRPQLRAWSAACSTGEEPYSLAMTFTEFFQQNPGWDIKILATDISTHVLRKAEAGVYESHRLDPLSPQQKQNHFIMHKTLGHRFYQVQDRLREMIRFRHLNLIDHWPFRGHFQVVFARNVMIYFDKATQVNLIQRFWEYLAPGGILCIGHSESLTGIEHKFKYLMPATYLKH